MLDTVTAAPRRSSEVDGFVQEMTNLIEVVDHVREVLLRYKNISNRLVRRVEKDESLVDALDALHGSLQRREVTEAIQELEDARHQIRLAMFALGKAQGASTSELGRALGISRQLAHRLVTEAVETLE
jgi:DNA-directed RNA polymerase specialized sigma subunit